MSEADHSGKARRHQRTMNGGAQQSPMEGESPASVERWQMGASAAGVGKPRSRRRSHQSVTSPPVGGLIRSNSGGVIRCSSGGTGDPMSSNSGSRRRVRQFEERALPPTYSATDRSTAVRSLGPSLSAASRMNPQSNSLSTSVASAFTAPSPSAGLDQRLARLNNSTDSDNSGEASSESPTSPTKKNKGSNTAIDMDTTPSTATARRKALINEMTVTLSETYAQHAPARWSADGQASESTAALSSSSSTWSVAPTGATPRSAGKKRVSPGADDTGLYQQSPQRRAIFPAAALEQGTAPDAFMSARAVPSRNRLTAVGQHPPRHPPLVTHMEDQRVASVSDTVDGENRGEDDDTANGDEAETKPQQLSAVVQEQQFSFDDDNMMESSPHKDRQRDSDDGASGAGTKQNTQRQQPNSLLHMALQKQQTNTAASKAKNSPHNNGVVNVSSATTKPKPPLASAPAPSGLSEVFAAAAAATAAAAESSADTAPITQEPINTNTDCLTLPSTPDLNSNNGLDNTEGNLIVHRNDVFRIPTQEIYDVSSGTNAASSSRASSRNGAVNLQRSSWAAKLNTGQATMDFQVLDLLGQGTFAQVFKCHIIGTNRRVAVKIVKNKPAYTRQAAVEIDIFRSLMEEAGKGTEAQQVATDGIGQGSNVTGGGSGRDHMVKLLAFFLHHQHLCLVFELLGLNLYEVLKRRQFRGLPLKTVREILRQALEAMKDLSRKSIVHCDLKPENMLMASSDFSPDEDASAKPPSNRGGNRSTSRRSKVTSTSTGDSDFSDRRIKIIDFGSACFEGKTAHTYIQSRFYRSPEVLVGLDYDSAIDMWSLGCVGAELFLGLPILPGVHEHDQLSRICEMIGTIPDRMLRQGSKSTKYFVKYLHKPDVSDLNSLGRAGSRGGGGGIGAAIAGMTAGGAPPRTPSPSAASSGASPPPPRVAWRLKTRDEFIATLSEDERLRRGGLSKLEQQPTNRYFRRKQLEDIVMLHGSSGMEEDKADMELFVHFLKGVLDPDPWERWTALQASTHPFITGSRNHQKRVNNLSAELVGTIAIGGSGRTSAVHWKPPLDTTVHRRRLNSVQRTREKKKAEGQMRPMRAQDSSTSVERQVRTQPNTPSEITKTANYLGPGHEYYTPLQPGEPPVHISGASRLAGMADAVHNVQPQVLLPQTHVYGRVPAAASPPASLGVAASRARQQSDLAMQAQLSASYGTVLGGDAALAYAAAAATPPHHLHLGGAGVDPAGQLHGMVMDGAYNSGTLLSPAVGGPGAAAFHDARFGAQRQMPLSTGPQSFSGFQYDGFGDDRFHVEGDFGYALQRPGVVPMGGDPNVLHELHGLSFALLSQHLPATQATLIRSGSFASQASLGGQIPSSPHTTPAGRNSAMSYTMGGTPTHLLPSSPLMYPLLRQDQMMASPAGHALPTTVDIGAAVGLSTATAATNSFAAAARAAPRPSLLAQQLAAHSSSSLQAAAAADADARAAAAVEAQRGLLRSSLEHAAMVANGPMPVGATTFAYGQIPTAAGAQQIFIGGGGGAGATNVDPMLISSPSGPLLHAHSGLGGGAGAIPRQAASFHAASYTRGQGFHGLPQQQQQQHHLTDPHSSVGSEIFSNSYSGLVEPTPPHMQAHALALHQFQHPQAPPHPPSHAIYPPEARPSSYR